MQRFAPRVTLVLVDYPILHEVLQLSRALVVAARLRRQQMMESQSATFYDFACLRVVLGTLRYHPAVNRHISNPSVIGHLLGSQSCPFVTCLWHQGRHFGWGRILIVKIP